MRGVLFCAYKRDNMANKATKITYWITTSLIFLTDGVLPAFTSNSEMAKQGTQHLGYPDYFRTMLTVFKVLGGLALILPFVKGRYKEWAYAGFGISMIAALVSNTAVDGFSGATLAPIIALAILATSYITYQKLHPYKEVVVFKDR